MPLVPCQLSAPGPRRPPWAVLSNLGNVDIFHPKQKISESVINSPEIRRISLIPTFGRGFLILMKDEFLQSTHGSCHLCWGLDVSAVCLTSCQCHGALKSSSRWREPCLVWVIPTVIGRIISRYLSIIDCLATRYKHLDYDVSVPNMKQPVLKLES